MEEKWSIVFLNSALSSIGMVALQKFSFAFSQTERSRPLQVALLHTLALPVLRLSVPMSLY